MLPAVALGLLAFRTFKGERVREEYQRRERQQQILRLLESDLSSWILSRCGESEKGALPLEVRQNRILLPLLNVYLSANHQRAAAPALPARDASLWHTAQAVEFREGQNAIAAQNYRRLLSSDSVVSSWSKLALLRLALRRNGLSDAAVWLREIQDTDQTVVTESGIPLRVAAALLLIGYDGAAALPEADGFLGRTLSQLASGSWPLNAPQWAYYAREICSALDPSSSLCSAALATAGSLESVAGAAHEVLVLGESLQWRRDQPVASCLLPGIQSVVILFPGENRNTGCILKSAEMAGEAETRLAALVAAEDFEGRVGISADNKKPALFLASLPFLEVTFPERDRSSWHSHLRRYLIFYASALLLLSAGTGLFFTYRAVAHEMEVNRMKAEFVSSVSHEFRTPLSAIEALLERLESGKVRDNEMLHRYYQASRREVQRLTAMVNQLLDFSRLKEGREEFSFETIDLNRLAEEAIQSFRNLGFSERLTEALFREAPLNVTADKEAAYQCIHNLIDNALKYSPDGSQVTVASGPKDNEVFLQVSDRGPGIEPQELELIFEQFYRAKSAGVHGVQGAGIGLALVKKVMQAHGGKVTLESRMGEGSTFQLTFPRPKP